MSEHKVTIPAGYDSRVPDGTSVSIDISPSWSYEQKEKALKNYLDARYGPVNKSVSTRQIGEKGNTRTVTDANIPPEKLPETYRGMRLVPPVDSKPATERFGEGLSGALKGILATMPGHAGGEVGEPIKYTPSIGQLLTHPIDTLQKISKENGQPQEETALTDYPIISDADRLYRGDIAGEVGSALPAILGGSLAVSPALRAGAKGAVKGGFSEAFGEPRSFRGVPVPPILAGTAGGSVTGHYLGSPLAGALGGAALTVLPGAIKGAVEGFKSAPLLDRSVLGDFGPTGPDKSSPSVITPDFRYPRVESGPQFTYGSPNPQAPPVYPPSGLSSPIIPPEIQPQLPPGASGDMQMISPPPNLPALPPPGDVDLAKPGVRVTEPPSNVPRKGFRDVKGRIQSANKRDFVSSGDYNPEAEYQGYGPTRQVKGQPEESKTVESKTVESKPVETPKKKGMTPPSEVVKNIESKRAVENPYDKTVKDSQVKDFVHKRVGTVAGDVQKEFGVSEDKAKQILVGLESKGEVLREGQKFVKPEGYGTKTDPETMVSKTESKPVQSPKDQKILQLQKKEKLTEPEQKQLDRLLKERDEKPTSQKGQDAVGKDEKPKNGKYGLKKKD
jgi:hypothetical protein